MTEGSLRIARMVAGEYFDRMTTSYENCSQFFRHSEAKARLGAILVARDLWTSETTLISDMKRVLRTDSDSNVRAAAITTLSSKVAEGDRGTGRLFAEIVMDETQDVICRYSAYLGVFAVLGREAEFLTGCKIPEDVDWELVRPFLVN